MFCGTSILKIHRISDEMILPEFFHDTVELTPDNSNLKETRENSSTERLFELSEAPVKANSDKNEMLVRVKAISS